MDIARFLTELPTSSGPLVWTFFASQVVGLLVGVYLAFLRNDTRAIRKQALQRLGYAMIGLGVLGIVVSGLRLSMVVPLNARYLSLIVAIFWIGLAIFAFYYSRFVYPAQVAAAVNSGKKSDGPRRVVTQQQLQRAANQTPAPAKNGDESSESTDSSRVDSTRRDARRERKRRKK